jgi:SAM-dependent methyltransferase
MQRASILALTVAATLATVSVVAQQATERLREPDVIYLPTPREAVTAMLKAANVGAGDVVYDLGSGDGRILITAVKDFGAARGVGVDIDPAMIREANDNADRAKVVDRVRFLNEDLFDTDLHEATVVTLYLLPWLNRKLIPKLKAELKPGARIVAYRFDMGDWKPDQTLIVNGQSIYVWRVP